MINSITAPINFVIAKYNLCWKNGKFWLVSSPIFALTFVYTYCSLTHKFNSVQLHQNLGFAPHCVRTKNRTFLLVVLSITRCAIIYIYIYIYIYLLVYEFSFYFFFHFHFKMKTFYTQDVQLYKFSQDLFFILFFQLNKYTSSNDFSFIH